MARGKAKIVFLSIVAVVILLFSFSDFAWADPNAGQGRANQDYSVNEATKNTDNFEVEESFTGGFTCPTTDIYNRAFSSDGGLVDIKTSDLDSQDALMQWLGKQEDFIFLKRSDDGQISYYFNTPNVQSSVANSVIDMACSFGWQCDYSASSLEEDSSKWTTAEKKYGYSFPTIWYSGEMPCATLDVVSIAQSNANPINAGKFAISWIMDSMTYSQMASLMDVSLTEAKEAYETSGAQVVLDLADASAEDVRSVTYNLKDYNDSYAASDEAVAEWLEQNFQVISRDRDKDKFDVTDGNGKSIFDVGTIVYDGECTSSTWEDDSGKTRTNVDVTWIDGQSIFNRLIEKFDGSYQDVLQTIIEYGQNELEIKPPSIELTRHMPYDLDSMDEVCRDYIGVADPRAEMVRAKGEKDTFYLSSMMSSTAKRMTVMPVLSCVSALSWFASSLNSICNLDFFKSNGIDLLFLWRGSIAELIMLVAGIGFLVMMVRSIISSAKGRGFGSQIRKVLSSFLVFAMLVGILAAPDATGKAISDISSVAFSMSSKVLDSNSSFAELSSPQASISDKSSLRYWALYYNAWSQVMTNHSYSDTASVFDPTQGTNEYYGFDKSIATLTGDDTIDSWPAILLEASQDGGLEMYRVVDHYMAPNVVSTDYPSFTVSQNRWYNGYVCSSYPVSQLLWAIDMVVLTLLKLICFIGFIVDIFLLLLKMAVGAFSGARGMREPVKALGRDIVKIIFYDTLITVTFLFATQFNEPGSTIFAIVASVTLVGMLKWFAKNQQHILSPSWLFKATSKVKSTVDKQASAIAGINMETARACKAQAKEFKDDIKG